MRAYAGAMLALAGIASIAIITWRRPARAAGVSSAPPHPLPDGDTALVPQWPADAVVQEVSRLIAEEAARQGVDARVALAFADRESRLRPEAQGDLQWPFRNGGALYRQQVLNHPHFAQNPYRTEPSLWHSYGLYQLLAPYHVGPLEDPRVLLDPRLNIERGVKVVRDVLSKSQGNLYEARRRYVGCGPGSGCERDAQALRRIDAAWSESLGKWGLV